MRMSKIFWPLLKIIIIPTALLTLARMFFGPEPLTLSMIGVSLSIVIVFLMALVVIVRLFPEPINTALGKLRGH